ncbi:MAG: TonB-dependent receptor [Methylococcales bacterium]|nr:TonB-dependent receptor [Methylococcales bacterium]
MRITPTVLSSTILLNGRIERRVVNLDYQVTKQVDLQFQVKNLTDTNREYAWYDAGFPEPLFSAGDGRAFYGAVNVKFDY